MQLIVPCPGCQKKLKASEKFLGRRVKCPSCGQVLGFDAEPTIEASQIDGAIAQRILFEFLGGLDGTVDGLVQKSRLRSATEVGAMEDRFYCAHNTVRGAQLGEDTVPDGFHPVLHGGVVHERRHALTWCLSAGTAWDDTDLST